MMSEKKYCFNLLSLKVVLILFILTFYNMAAAAELSEKTKKIIEKTVQNVSYTVNYTGKTNKNDAEGYTTKVKFNFKDANNFAFDIVESTSFLSGKSKNVSLNGEYWAYQPEETDAIVTLTQNQDMLKPLHVLKFMCDNKDYYEVSESKNDNLITVTLKSTILDIRCVFTIDAVNENIIEFNSANDAVGSECKGEYSDWQPGVDEQAFEKPAGVKTITIDEYLKGKK